MRLRIEKNKSNYIYCWPHYSLFIRWKKCSLTLCLSDNFTDNRGYIRNTLLTSIRFSQSLGWPAGLDTSFMYGGFLLLQNLNDIELIIDSKPSFTSSQLFFSNSFCPICALPIIQIQTESYGFFFGVFPTLTSIFCLS